MNSVISEWWAMALPEEWNAEVDEETIIVADEDDVGVIELTTLELEDEYHGNLDDVKAFAEDNAGAAIEPTRLNDFPGFYCEYEDDGDWVREWYLLLGAQLLLVTYSCDMENAKLDDTTVNEILSTLELIEEE